MTEDGRTDAGAARKGRMDRLLGSAADPGPEPARRRTDESPPAVRRAALVAAVEAALLTGVSGWLLVQTVTEEPATLGSALGLVVLTALAAAALAAGAVGLWRVSGWARGPVVALQVFLGLTGLVLAFQAGQPALGLPVLVLVATELYLLASPEARLAFSDR